MQPSAPFIHSKNFTPFIMWLVAFSLLFPIAGKIFLYDSSILVNQFTSILSAVFFEAIFLKLQSKKIYPTIIDGSSIVVAMIVSYSLPSDIPIQVIIVANFIAMATKHVYGGLGMNMFNPAMVGFASVLMAFPNEMSSWSWSLAPANDAISHATPLGTHKMNDLSYLSLSISQFLILIGGTILVLYKIIKITIPLFVLLSFAFVVSINSYVMDLDIMDELIFHLLSGSILFGAIFVATDPVEMPHKFQGQIAYAIIIGTLIATIRLFSSYAEGVAFAVLLGNFTTPLIDVMSRKAHTPDINLK
jgi:electron transport complex protein RnfD